MPPPTRQSPFPHQGNLPYISGTTGVTISPWPKIPRPAFSLWSTSAALRLAAPAAAFAEATRVRPTGHLQDSLRRPLHDLRISVTDRCNFRCSYCMPKEVFDKDYVYLPQPELLSFEEITRIASQFVAHGVEKIRLTGGEPLLRKNLEVLITQLAALRHAAG